MPKRINKAIELLEQGQPVYATGTEEVSYEAGRAMAQTWADLIRVGMEHGPFDMAGLRDFMRGLKDGGPTPSGHLTPTVTVELPVLGTSEAVTRANAWMFAQALATGVHGILFCHANEPESLRVFIEASRYPFPQQGVGAGLGVGQRGSAAQKGAGSIWGLTGPEYVEKADVWPLNPNGELLMGIKVENRIALENVEKTTQVPGIAYAEWGPGDMGFSFGHIDAHDPPYPPEMVAARSRIMAALKAANWHFFEAVTPDIVIDSIKEGVIICGGGEEAAKIGRAHTGRTMPV